MKSIILRSSLITLACIAGGFLLYGLTSLLIQSDVQEASEIQKAFFALDDFFRRIEVLGYYILGILVILWGGTSYFLISGKKYWGYAFLSSSITVTVILALVQVFG